MTKEIKTIVALIVLIAVVIIGWVWYGMSNTAPQAPAVQSPVSNQENTSAAADAGLTTSASDSSDTTLQSDLDSVNAQMNSLNSDTSSISN